MNSNLSWIIWILIPIAIILVCVLAKILFDTAKTKSRKEIIEKISKSIQKERLTRADAILSRVRIISNNNDEFQPLYDELMWIWDDMDELIKEINMELFDVSLSKNKINSKDFFERTEALSVKVKELDKIDKKFKAKSWRIAQQDDSMRQGYAFYHSNFRKVVSVYRQKRVSLDKIASKIDGIISEIKEDNKKFNEKLEEADTQNASEALTNLSLNIIKLAEVINEGPTIQTYIYETIPTKVKELITLYKTKKIETTANFDHINFVKEINDISRNFTRAREQFLSLNFKNTKKTIRETFRNLKILERQITVEIQSREIFVENYPLALKQSKTVFSEFVKFKKEISIMKERKMELSEELLKGFQELSEKAAELDKKAIDFNHSAKTNDIPFSSKLSGAKLFLQDLSSFIGNLNDLKKKQWELIVERQIAKNKLIKTESAINNLLSQAKRDKVVLTPKEEKYFIEINNVISALFPILKHKRITEEEKELVERVTRRTTNYYRVVGGKIELARITRNLILKLAPQRSVNSRLHYQINVAEREYLQGKYDSALNTIVTFLEEGE